MTDCFLSNLIYGMDIISLLRPNIFPRKLNHEEIIMILRNRWFSGLLALLFSLVYCLGVNASEANIKTTSLGKLKPMDSFPKVKTGQMAPDFTLPAISDQKITLSQYRGKKNVVLSFVPAAWTPVCSKQWPGFSTIKNYFVKGDTELLGITVDNIPTLYAWTQKMGNIWFEVLSDFWPHGAVADKYGVLRSDGLTERALFFIDKKGIIRGIVVTDINKQPDLDVCLAELEKLND
jgi:peroxiredoxin